MKTRLTRKLVRTDRNTGKKGDAALLTIDEDLILLEDADGMPLAEPTHMTCWYPVADSGELVDGIVRIEVTGRGTLIAALTDSRRPGHPLFAWLRALAKDLQSMGIAYEPYLRKDERQDRVIIDVIRI